MLAKFAKGPACQDCALESIGFGFASAVGPADAPLVFLGESLGRNEALYGEPFVGAAGAMLDRLLRAAQISRSHIKIHNAVNCQPPENWLDGAPWQHSALTHCSAYVADTLANPHIQVVVALGNVSMKQTLDLWGVDGVTLNNFHGTVHRDPTDRFWVIPTYHPSFLQRGATNLFDVARFDLDVARRVLQHGYTRRPVDLVLDPPVERFRAKVAEAKARHAAGDLFWLPVDIETPETAGGVDENELTADSPTADIQRVNFSFSYDDGWTVPYLGPYIPLIEELLVSGLWLAMWNKPFDESRLRIRGHKFLLADGQPTTIVDFMWAAHHLQSDWPLGLGFWAPFYSDWGAWKHLAKQRGQDVLYAAIDGLQTNRVGPYGIAPALDADGMWEAFWRHTHLREQYVLRPAHQVGVPVDVERLDHFHTKLQGIAAEKLTAINAHALAGTLRPKAGYAKKPKGDPPVPPKSILGKAGEKGDTAKQEYILKGVQLVEREVSVTVQDCNRCGSQRVTPRHHCKRSPVGDTSTEGTIKGTGQPELVPRLATETRWFWHLPFNPDSPQQLLRFITDSGEAPGRQKKTKKPTTDKATLKKLGAKTGDPVYTHLLDYKAVKKVDATYAVGTKRRLWTDGRIHPTITFRPSMFRDSSVNPNIQNVVADKEGRDTLAAGFRDCIVARPGYRIVEVDYAGTEGLDTGWLSGDPHYIRLATLGVHAYLTSFILTEQGILSAPADLAWSDADLAAFFKEIKKKYPLAYDKSKRCVHGNNYGLTPYGMHETFPELYPTLKDAEHVQEVYYTICPKLSGYHKRVRACAADTGYLGGRYVDDYTLLAMSGKHHPWSYRHWFWGVESLRPLTQKEYLRLQWIARKRMKLAEHPRVRIINNRPFEQVLGEDSKRVIAFGPQSISAGKLKEAQLALFHPESATYIGEIADGQTPFLGPIHDSLLLHMPDRVHEWAIAIIIEVMRRPMWTMPMPAEWGLGSHLRTNVDVKVSPVGGSWAECQTIKIPEMMVETAADGLYMPAEMEQWDEVEDLQARVL